MTKTPKTPALKIPLRLKSEFATVHAAMAVPLKASSTQNLDGLILSWVKFEKQVRKVFCFLIYQHESVVDGNWEKVQKTISENDALNTKTLIEQIHALTGVKIFDTIKKKNPALAESISSIRDVRHKIMHGQVTGNGLNSKDLRSRTQNVVNWMELIRRAAFDAYGYDGIERYTYLAAKDGRKIVVTKFPFKDFKGLLEWVEFLNRGPNYKKKLKAATPP